MTKNGTNGAIKNGASAHSNGHSKSNGKNSDLLKEELTKECLSRSNDVNLLLRKLDLIILIMDEEDGVGDTQDEVVDIDNI